MHAMKACSLYPHPLVSMIIIHLTGTTQEIVIFYFSLPLAPLPLPTLVFSFLESPLTSNESVGGKGKWYLQRARSGLWDAARLMTW